MLTELKPLNPAASFYYYYYLSFFERERERERAVEKHRKSGTEDPKQALS